MRVQPFGSLYVLQVLVVCVNEKWIQHPFQPVVPHFQSQPNSKTLPVTYPVTNVTVSICGQKFLGEEGHTMELGPQAQLVPKLNWNIETCPECAMPLA